MILVEIMQDREAARFLGNQLGTVFVPPYEVLGVFRRCPDDELILCGGFVFTCRSTCNVDVSVWGPGCMMRGILSAAAAHVFETLGCLRATARCRRSNVSVRRLLVKGGWREEGVQRRFFGPTRHHDAMIYGLLASELPVFLKPGGSHATGPAGPARNGTGANGDESGYSDYAIPTWGD